jgi:hypothetical protein
MHAVTPVDYASFLIDAEKKLSRVYPLMCDRKAAQAILQALEVQEALTGFITHVLRKHAK